MEFSPPPLTGNVEFDTWMQGFVEIFRLALIGKTDEFSTFAADDATPDVGDGSCFKTANTSPTTITNFDNGKNGQLIWVIINDGNTTIDFTGTNLKGNAGVDWSPASGDFMICKYDGTNWYCLIGDTTT